MLLCTSIVLTILAGQAGQLDTPVNTTVHTETNCDVHISQHSVDRSTVIRSPIYRHTFTDLPSYVRVNGNLFSFDVLLTFARNGSAVNKPKLKLFVASSPFSSGWAAWNLTRVLPTSSSRHSTVVRPLQREPFCGILSRPITWTY